MRKNEGILIVWYSMVYVSITGFEDRAAYGNGDPAGKRDYKTIRLGQAAGPGTCAVSNGSPAPGPRRASQQRAGASETSRETELTVQSAGTERNRGNGGNPRAASPVNRVVSRVVPMCHAMRIRPGLAHAARSPPRARTETDESRRCECRLFRLQRCTDYGAVVADHDRVAVRGARGDHRRPYTAVACRAECYLPVVSLVWSWKQGNRDCTFTGLNCCAFIVVPGMMAVHLHPPRPRNRHRVTRQEARPHSSRAHISPTPIGMAV